MTIEDRRQCQDITIINFEKRKPKDTDGQRNGNPILQALVIILFAALLIAIGYIACLKAGIFAPPSEPCCFGTVELDFDFDA